MSDPITREQLEQALDSGRLEVQWRNGRWHTVRRNGATKTWKRDPERFVIPCKTGFRDCFTIAFYSTDAWNGGHTLTSPYLRIRPTRED